MYMRTVESTTNDSLVHVFGCYALYWRVDNRDSLTGEEFCGKNLLMIYLRFCHIEKGCQ